MSTDPEGQYHSPYMAMGNNPMNQIDPDGGWSCCGGGPGVWVPQTVQATSRDLAFQVWVKVAQPTFTSSLVAVASSTATASLRTLAPIQKYPGSTGSLKTWEPGTMYAWSQSNNLLKKGVYEMLDAPYVTAHFFMPGKEVTHLNGDWATPNERVAAFGTNMTAVVPVGQVPWGKVLTYGARYVPAPLKAAFKATSTKLLTPQVKKTVRATTKYLTKRADDVGKYTLKIRWGIQDIEVRPFAKGFWGKRVPQNNPRVDAFELKVNPNNESFYLPHPDGGFVQYENIVNVTVQDGKLIMDQSSIYHVLEKPEFLVTRSILEPAQRQLAAAQAAGYKVEWLVSDEKAVQQLTQYFREKNVDITVKLLKE